MVAHELSRLVRHASCRAGHSTCSACAICGVSHTTGRPCGTLASTLNPPRANKKGPMAWPHVSCLTGLGTSSDTGPANMTVIAQGSQWQCRQDFSPLKEGNLVLPLSLQRDATWRLACDYSSNTGQAVVYGFHFFFFSFSFSATKTQQATELSARFQKGLGILQCGLTRECTKGNASCAVGSFRCKEPVLLVLSSTGRHSLPRGIVLISATLITLTSPQSQL